MATHKNCRSERSSPTVQSSSLAGSWHTICLADSCRRACKRPGLAIRMRGVKRRAVGTAWHQEPGHEDLHRRGRGDRGDARGSALPGRRGRDVHLPGREPGSGQTRRHPADPGGRDRATCSPGERDRQDRRGGGARPCHPGDEGPSGGAGGWGGAQPAWPRDDGRDHAERDSLVVFPRLSRPL